MPPPRENKITKTPRRTSRHKKPRDMPSRPLSAYNFFFREERLRIVQAGAAADPKNTKNPPQKSDQHEAGSSAGPQGLDNHNQGIAKTISERWKLVSPHDRQRYQALAEDDKRRYRHEMELYYRQSLGQPDTGGTVEKPAPRSSRSSATASTAGLQDDGGGGGGEDDDDKGHDEDNHDAQRLDAIKVGAGVDQADPTPPTERITSFSLSSSNTHVPLSNGTEMDSLATRLSSSEQIMAAAMRLLPNSLPPPPGQLELRHLLLNDFPLAATRTPSLANAGFVAGDRGVAGGSAAAPVPHLDFLGLASLQPGAAALDLARPGSLPLALLSLSQQQQLQQQQQVQQQLQQQQQQLQQQQLQQQQQQLQQQQLQLQHLVVMEDNLRRLWINSLWQNPLSTTSTPLQADHHYHQGRARQIDPSTAAAEQMIQPGAGTTTTSSSSSSSTLEELHRLLHQQQRPPPPASFPDDDDDFWLRMLWASDVALSASSSSSTATSAAAFLPPPSRQGSFPGWESGRIIPAGSSSFLSPVRTPRAPTTTSSRRPHDDDDHDDDSEAEAPSSVPRRPRSGR